MILLLFAHINSTNHQQLIANSLPVFSLKFQEKILKFRRWEDAQLSLLGRMLLREGLKMMNRAFDEKSIRFTKYNKPFFEKGNVHFNISHAGEIVVCTLTDVAEIGVDIEKIHQLEVADFKSQMTDNEWVNINNSASALISFFDYWTKKEAALKAQGNGLSINLKSFEIINNQTTIYSETIYLKELVFTDDYKCYVALKKEIDNSSIEKHKINPLDLIDLN